MPQLSWAPLALADLAEIDVYLVQRNGAAAARILRAIRASAERLLEYPRLGRVLDDPIRILGVRRTTYLLAYRIAEDGIEIARVRHRRENWAVVR